MAGGYGWKTEESTKAIEAAQKAGENVVHVGFIDDKDGAAFYQKASLFVMPSIYEGFGMPVLEAMASNCPVVASNIPVLREVGGDAALYAKVGDSDSFCNVMKEVINNKNIQKEMIIKGKKNLDNFSLTKNSEAIYNKTKELLINK